MLTTATAMAAVAPTTALPTVYICGPIAIGNEPARGGFQSCNRRTIEALREHGVRVGSIPYPHPRTSGIRKYVEYMIGFLTVYWQVLCCPRGSILHVTAVGVHFIYNEFVLVWLARVAGCKVVFDVRAGAARDKYDRSSPVFRFVFRQTLRLAHLLMVEGEAFQDFIESIVGRRPVHLPNHLDMSLALSASNVERSSSTASIVYVGRLVPEKGIETILLAVRLLRESGFGVSLHVVGEGEDRYVEHLKVAYQDTGAVWVGPLPPQEVLKAFHRGHFFLFPTRHFGEGQSNALTEAMACGVVPIVSRHGFNESVAGNAGMVLDLDSEPSAWADAVRTLWTNGSWGERSRECQSRAQQRFSTQAVIGGLVDSYRRLVNQ